MKRSDELRLLSVEHHHALFQAMQLRKAASGGLPLMDTVRSFLKNWDEMIHPHFLIEEEHLIPPYERIVGEGHSHINRTWEDHEVLRQSVESLRGSDEKIAKSLIMEIGERLSEHIRFEERELFPEIEKVVGIEALTEIGKKIEELCVKYE